MSCTDIDVETIKYELYQGGVRRASESIYEDTSRNPLVLRNLVQDGNTLKIAYTDNETFATFKDEQTAYSVMTILENAGVCADFIMGECTTFVDEASNEVCDDCKYVNVPGAEKRLTFPKTKLPNNDLPIWLRDKKNEGNK